MKRKTAAPQSLKTVWLADMHVGSRWAVARPDDSTRKDRGREVQKQLYDAWAAAAAGPYHQPDALILMGDAVDGQNRKQGGRDQWTTDIDEQVCSAADLVGMWDAKKIFVIGGSGYHVIIGDSGVSAEEMLAQRLKAEFYPNQEHIPESDRRRSGPHLFLTFAGVTVHAAHHIAMSRVFHYMSTPIARQMMQAKLNDPMRQAWEKMYHDHVASPSKAFDRAATIWKTSIIMRAHAHYFWACDAGGSQGVICPAWKLPDQFILDRDPLGFRRLAGRTPRRRAGTRRDCW